MKIVVSGYYGFGNAGDEAILEAMLRDVRALAPAVRVVVLSGDPADTSARFGVEAVPRMNPGAVMRALRGADLFLSGGGSLLQDATGWGSVPYYAGLMGVARRLGVPVVVYAQGVGPLRRPWLRRLAAAAVGAASEITVRDRLSCETLRELGVDPARIRVTADPVFGLAPVTSRPDGGLPRAGVDVPRGGRLIGVCLRPLPGRRGQADTERLVEAVAEALRPRLPQWNAYVVPLPLHGGVDDGVHRLLLRKLATMGAAPRVLDWPAETSGRLSASGRAGGDGGGRAWGAGRWMELFAGLDLCLTMRLHGLIFAACAGTPVVALSDDPKAAAHVDELGLDPDQCLVAPSSCSPRTLGAALDMVWRGRREQRERLMHAVPELAARARLTAPQALRWAKGRRQT